MFMVDSTGSNDSAFNMVRVLARQKVGLKIVHLNAQSLHCKMDEFRYLFVSSGVDIICVSETWFRLDIDDCLYELNGFRLYRSDRSIMAGGIENRAKGGGVAIYVRCGINCSVKLKSSAGSEIEFLLLEVNDRRNRKILIGSFYRPHRNMPVEPIINIFEEISVQYSDLVILGDFNCNLLANNPFIGPMSSLGLTPLNTDTPTHFHGQSGSLIDIVFVNDKSKILLYDQISVSAFSNHDLLFVTYELSVSDISPVLYTFRDIRNLDYILLDQYFESINWHQIYSLEDVNDQLSFLQNNLNNLYEVCVPLRTRRVRPNREPWFTSSIEELIKIRNVAYSRWKRFRSDELYREFQSCRKNVVRCIKRSKCLYYGSKFSSAIDSKSKWRQIRKIGIGRRVTPPSNVNVNIDRLNETFLNIDIPHLESNVYENFCSVPIETQFGFRCVTHSEVFETFSAVKSQTRGMDGLDPTFIRILLPRILPFITHLCNTVLTKSVFPNGWKQSKIIPIPKQNNEFRPIAILPFLSKIMEKIMSRQISEYLRQQNLLSEKQSGFVKGRSCITALTDVVESLRSSLDRGNVSFLVLLDHSKAFDTVDHLILMTKLKKLFYFSPAACKLIQTYLAGRSQTVFYNGKCSGTLNVNRGVPQGSILGPLLFCMYINDLPNVLEHSGIQMYADDVQIFSSCEMDLVSQCIDGINSDLVRINQWAANNGLRINPAKSKCIFLSRNNRTLNDDVAIRIDDNVIQFVSSCKNLGVTFDDKLSWSGHIAATVGRVYGMLRNLWAVKYSTPLEIRSLLAKTYLIPVLLYCCEIFASCTRSDFNKLRVAYNNIARYVFDRGRFDSISRFSYKLYNMTFENLLKFRCLILLHKIITTQQPNYLFGVLRFGRSVRGRKLIQQRYRSTFSQRQFLIHCTTLWNQLPHQIQNINDARRFKRELQEYLS